MGVSTMLVQTTDFSQFRELRPPSGENPPQGGGGSGSQTEVMKGEEGAHHSPRGPHRSLRAEAFPGESVRGASSRNPLCYCYTFRGQGILPGRCDNQNNNNNDNDNNSPRSAAGILEKTSSCCSRGRGKHKVRPWEDLI